MDGANDVELRKQRILVIDSDRWNVELVERMLDWAGFSDVHSCLDPKAGLTTFKRLEPDLVIFDVHTEQMNGFALLESMRNSSADGPFLPILVFSSDRSRETLQRALRLGATDFLTKPGDSTEILLRVCNFLRMRQMYKNLRSHQDHLEKLVQERVKEVEATQLELHRRLAFVAEYRDDKTGEHTIRVGDISAQIALALGWREKDADVLRLAAQLHDIGKVGIPDSILQKPDRLEPEEFEMMKKHTTIGSRILAGGRARSMQMAEVIAANHHERWDGQGYPKGLKGDQIPEAARIVAVADTFDALTHERLYRPAFSFQESLRILASERGKQLDPKAVEAFLKVSKTPGFQNELRCAA